LANRTRLLRHFSVAVFLAAIAAAAALAWRAPEPVPAVTLVSLEGQRIALTDLRGQAVLINFWATSCPICVEEMPAMVETYRRYHPRGLQAVFVAMPYDRPDHVLAYTRAKELPFPVALDVQGEAARAFGGIRGTPTTLLVDRRGRIVERILGEPDFPRLHELIERTLDQPA
jgi:peroxiredoxin